MKINFNFLKKVIQNINESVINLKDHKYFEYLSYFGVLCVLKFIISASNIKMSIGRRKSCKKDGWVIFTDATPAYVESLCLDLLNLNQNYKILLIGENEEMLRMKVDRIKVSKNNAIIEYFKYENINHNLIEEIKSKFSNIENEISIINMNSNLITFSLFEKLNFSTIKNTINSNLTINQLILNLPKNKDCLIIGYGDTRTSLNLPYIQLYSACKNMLKDQITNTKMAYLYIDDFHDSNQKKILKFNFNQRGFIYLSIKTYFTSILMQMNCILNIHYKRKIIEELKII